MDDILGFLPAIIAVLLWVFGLSKANEKKNSNQPKQMKRASTAQHQSQEEQQTSVPEETLQSEPKIEPIPASGEASFQDQKRDQMERLKEKLQNAQDVRQQQLGEHDALPNRPSLKRQSENKKIASLSLKSNLTTKGIAQGLIMAEVLGKPKAYQNIQKKNSYKP